MIITDLKQPINKINTPVGSIFNGKKLFVDKDATGRRIESTAKSSKSIEVEGDSRFCGKRFFLGSKLYGDKKCLYCGIWFHWKDTDYQAWVKTGNIDRLNLDNNVEPLHCGKDHCIEFHKLSIEAEEARLRAVSVKDYETYKYMQRKGLVD